MNKHIGFFMSSYLGPQTPPVLSYQGHCGPLPLLSLILS
jgi:hypothetical protein